jgi:hypothetical protein
MALKLVDPSLLERLMDSNNNDNSKPAERKVHWDYEKLDMFKATLNNVDVKQMLSHISELDSNGLVQENIDNVVEANCQMFNDAAEKASI